MEWGGVSGKEGLRLTLARACFPGAPAVLGQPQGHLLQRSRVTAGVICPRPPRSPPLTHHTLPSSLRWKAGHSQRVAGGPEAGALEARQVLLACAPATGATGGRPSRVSAPRKAPEVGFCCWPSPPSQGQGRGVQVG